MLVSQDGQYGRISHTILNIGFEKGIDNQIWVFMIYII